MRAPAFLVVLTFAIGAGVAALPWQAMDNLVRKASLDDKDLVDEFADTASVLSQKRGDIDAVVDPTLIATADNERRRRSSSASPRQQQQQQQEGWYETGLYSAAEFNRLTEDERRATIQRTARHYALDNKMPYNVALCFVQKRWPESGLALDADPSEAVLHRMMSDCEQRFPAQKARGLPYLPRKLAYARLSAERRGGLREALYERSLVLTPVSDRPLLRCVLSHMFPDTGNLPYHGVYTMSMYWLQCRAEARHAG